MEETVAQELEKWVSPVGQTVETDGYRLTVDAYVYDNETRSGFITLALEHDEPLDETRLQKQPNGGIWPYMLEINQYGYAYQIPEKTTDGCLAMTYYFHTDNPAAGAVFAITLANRDEQEAQKVKADFAAKRQAVRASLS